MATNIQITLFNVNTSEIKNMNIDFDESVALRNEILDKFIFGIIFPNYRNKRYKHTSGSPDYMLVNGKSRIYVEIKRGEDGLRQNQVQWFGNNKDKKIFVLYIGFRSIPIDKPKFVYDPNSPYA